MTVNKRTRTFVHAVTSDWVNTVNKKEVFFFNDNIKTTQLYKCYINKSPQNNVSLAQHQYDLYNMTWLVIYHPCWPTLGLVTAVFSITSLGASFSFDDHHLYKRNAWTSSTENAPVRKANIKAIIIGLMIVAVHLQNMIDCHVVMSYWERLGRVQRFDCGLKYATGGPRHYVNL